MPCTLIRDTRVMILMFGTLCLGSSLGAHYRAKLLVKQLALKAMRVCGLFLASERAQGLRIARARHGNSLKAWQQKSTPLFLQILQSDIQRRSENILKLKPKVNYYYN